MSAIAFHRVLKPGFRGRDVIAVKRALSRAGYLKWGKFTPIFGPFAKKALIKFQARSGIPATGQYDGKTHAKLLPHFDKFARKLYEASSKKPAMPVGGTANLPSEKGKLLLHKDFTPTHETAGLPGYPAIDEFAPAGTIVLAPESGKVIRHSGHDPRQGGVSGGAYGWSIYLDSPSGVHYMTHFATRRTSVGMFIRAGTAIGTVCDSAVAHKPGTSHIHHGKHNK
jgi:hypothetical protein